MALPGFGPLVPPADVAASTASAASEEDPSKRVRKPYTITKSRESWTEPEHDKFLEALQLFDRDWKKIEAFVGSKSVIQIRSHAQKYFQKVQKSGTNEHLPPPRPKRKAAHPYPQKATKASQAPTRASGIPLLLETEYVQEPDSSSIRTAPINKAPVAASWENNTAPAVSLPVMTKVPDMITNCCSTSEIPKAEPVREPIDQVHTGHMLRVLPDFSHVYRFIGSVFDPDASGHLQKLKKMDLIDFETALLLMRNLSINLTSPDFEDIRKSLSTYETDSDTTDPRHCK